MLSTVQRKSEHFIRKNATAEWPVIKAVQTDCMHSLFTSHFLPFISNKKPNFKDFDGQTFFLVKLYLYAKCIPKWAVTGKSMSSSDLDAADLYLPYYNSRIILIIVLVLFL